MSLKINSDSKLADDIGLQNSSLSEFVGFSFFVAFGALRKKLSLDFFGSFFYQEKNEHVPFAKCPLVRNLICVLYFHYKPEICKRLVTD